MKCEFCEYEFCWACGANATGYGHFQGQNGCGVSLHDNNVKPGDGNSKCCFILKVIGKILLCIILWPFALVLGSPCLMAYKFGELAK